MAEVIDFPKPHVVCPCGNRTWLIWIADGEMAWKFECDKCGYGQALTFAELRENLNYDAIYSALTKLVMHDVASGRRMDEPYECSELQEAKRVLPDLDERWR